MPVTPSPAPSDSPEPETELEIPEEAPPLADLPELPEVPAEPAVPTVTAPPEGVVIVEEGVPLGDLPQTGIAAEADPTPLLGALVLCSALALSGGAVVLFKRHI